jgi:hypothetical protein
VIAAAAMVLFVWIGLLALGSIGRWRISSPQSMPIPHLFVLWVIEENQGNSLLQIASWEWILTVTNDVPTLRTWATNFVIREVHWTVDIFRISIVQNLRLILEIVCRQQQIQVRSKKTNKKKKQSFTKPTLLLRHHN